MLKSRTLVFVFSWLVIFIAFLFLVISTVGGGWGPLYISVGVGAVGVALYIVSRRMAST